MTGAKGSEIITAMNNSKGRAMSDFVSNVRLHNGFNKALMLNYTLPFTSPMAGQTILLTNKLSPDAPTQNLGLQYDEAASSAQIDAARQEFSAAKAQYQSMLDQLNGVTSTGSSAPMGTNGQRTAQDIMMNWNFTYGV